MDAQEITSNPNSNENDNPQIPQVQQQQDQGQQICVMIRDLDSGVYSIDPGTLDVPQTLPSQRKASAWQNYWHQRDNIKHQLVKYINNAMDSELTELLATQCKDMDLNDIIYMDGWTLLHHAATKKCQKVVLTLLNNGLQVNTVTESMRRTALHLAVLQKSEQIIRMLLAYGANPNAQDIDYCTPVHYASQFGYLEIIRIFLTSCQNLAIGQQNIKRMSVMACCRDLRIRKMIWEYCVLYGIQIKEEEVMRRDGDDDRGKGRVLLARTRSDFIQRILAESNKPYSSCQELEVKQPQFVSWSKKQQSYPIIGSKLSKHKLQKITSFAKKSLQNFKESQNSTLVESIQNYQLIKQLGAGTFGTVFLIRKKKSSRLFALKRLSKKLIFENKMKKYAYAQREILKNIKHPFILHAHSFFQDPAYLYMVMDFCAGGDLEKQVRKTKFDQQKARKYCCQVVLALEELHSRNYLFRDLKVSNVLLDEFGHAKLADFGLAKQSEMSHSFLGSVAYLAPEMLVETDNKPHTFSIDWYLLGVFVFEMLVGMPPFFNENRMAMFQNIKRQKPRLPATLTPDCKDFILKTLAKKPHERLGHRGAQQIKKHPWFKQIDWKVVLEKGLIMDAPQINQKQLRTKQYIEEQECMSESSDVNNFRGWDFFQGDRPLN